jgi:hypothetical protein
MKTVRIFVQALVAGTLAVAALGTGAQGAESDQLDVFGYITGAVATPVAFVYDQPSFGVPASPTFEIRYMHSESHIDSGPSGRSLSSIVWPGDLAGNAPPSLVIDTFVPRDLIAETDQEDEGWTQFRDGLVEGSSSSPPYPVRAEAFYPQTPHAQSNNVGGGLSMYARTVQRQTEAETVGSKAGFPGLYSASHLNSSTFSGIRDGIAVAEATASAKEMSLLDGLIKVQGFSTTKTLSSDGVTAKVEGSLQVSGLTIAGTRVLSLDNDGPKLGDSAIPWDQAMNVIHERLEPQGITVKIAQDTKSLTGPEGRSHVYGISVRLDSRAMKAFADNLPEPLRGFVTSPGSSPAGDAFTALPDAAEGFANSIVQFDQSLTVLLGDVSVSSVASPPFDFTIIPPPAGGDFTPPFSPQLDVPPPGGGFPVADAPGVTTPPQTFAPPTSPVAATTGVPVPLAVIVFLLAAMGSVGLRTLADKALIARAGTAAPGCTLAS